jgi:hypothetical protein
MPRALIFMLNLVKKHEPIALHECEGWATGSFDVVSIPGDRWAFGVWDEHWSDGYRAHPDLDDFPLKEVTARDVIALCHRQDRSLPVKLLCELAAGPNTTPPSKAKKTDRIGELKKLDFVRITATRMKKEWLIGRDKLNLMADRAVRADRIHPDYQIIPGKQPQLWARLKP